ncbi:MAG TPA: hypothetical protein VE868_07800 [Balneolaceae bacterium]|nr:hypothetical protein [Balneolaceae bacterium]
MSPKNDLVHFGLIKNEPKNQKINVANSRAVHNAEKHQLAGRLTNFFRQFCIKETIITPPGFSALRALSTLITRGFKPKKICLKAAGWGRLKEHACRPALWNATTWPRPAGIPRGSRLSLSFSALFCRPFFAQTKKGRTIHFKKRIFLIGFIPILETFYFYYHFRAAKSRAKICYLYGS